MKTCPRAHFCALIAGQCVFALLLAVKSRAADEPASTAPIPPSPQTASSCESICDSCDDHQWDPWYAQADALFLHRDNRSTNQPVVIDDLSGATLLTTRDPDLNTSAGPRFLVGYRFSDCAAFEATYFGLQHWQGSSSVTGANNLDIPGDLGLATNDFHLADLMRVDYSSNINNVELNFIRAVSDTDNGFSALAGFRYFQLNENFNISATDADSFNSNYHIHTRNSLFGAQLGGRFKRCYGNLGLDFTGKAGIFGNAAAQNQTVGDFNNTITLRDASAHGSQTAFVGELGLNATYHVSNNLSVRGGYNLFWIDGVALAPDQLDFTFTASSGTTIASKGNVFMHGPSVGAEVRW